MYALSQNNFGFVSQKRIWAPSVASWRVRDGGFPAISALPVVGRDT